jgi:hypothetical protein
MKHSADMLDYIPGRERASDDLIVPSRIGPKLRRLLVTSTMLSLLLFVASSMSWMHSIHRRDMIGWAGWKDQSIGMWQGRGIAAADGELAVYWFTGTYQFDDPYSIGATSPTMQPHFVRVSRRYSVAGEHKFRSVDNQLGVLPLYPLRIRLLSIPIWLPTIVFAIAPGIWLIVIARRTQRRRSRGFPLQNIISNPGEADDQNR